MNTIVKATSAAEFLSLVPRMLGFVPVRSVVMIPFAGSRSLGALRFDLPGDAGEDGPDAVDRIAATVVGMVCRIADAEAVAIAVYTDARFSDGGIPHAALAVALERRADACGLRTADALCVAADGWASYLGPDRPAEVRPLAELVSDAAGLPLPDADQASGAQLPHVAEDELAEIERAYVALDGAVALLCGPAHPPKGRKPSGRKRSGQREKGVATRVELAASAAKRATDAGDDTDAGSGTDAAGTVDAERGAPRIDPRALAAVGGLDDLPALFESALGWDPERMDAFQAATLAWCLDRPGLRDIALVQWSGESTAGDEALDAQLRWEGGAEYPARLALHMWGESESADPERLERALGIVRRIAASAPPYARPGPLAMCAWLAWALGRSTHADLYALQACEIEPEHGLAEIVRSFVHAGHLPAFLW